jgi:acetyl esterase/lipase
MPRVLAVLGLFALPALADAAAPPPTAPTYEITQALDLAYVEGAGSRQRLDVFSPKADGLRFPVVIFVHGGTWVYGDKDFGGLYRNAGKNLARNGVVAVMINYRLSPLVRHPEHARDVARAYAWVVNNVQRYGGDPDRIILAGHSAGGHLAALIAADERYLKDPKLRLTDRQRQSLRGVVSLCGVYRAPKRDEFQRMLDAALRGMIGDREKSRFAKIAWPVMRVVGDGLNPFPYVFGSDAEANKQASPLAFVHKGMPPHLLVTAEWEVPCLRAMASEYEAALKKSGCDVTYKDLDNCRHKTLPTCLHSNEHEACKLVLAFVREHAGGPEKKGK